MKIRLKIWQAGKNWNCYIVYQMVPTSSKKIKLEKNLLWWLWGCAGSMMSGSLDAGVRWSWSIFKHEKLRNSKTTFFKFTMSTMILKIFWIICRSVCLSEANDYCLFQNQNHLDGLLVKTNMTNILIILFSETNILV